MAIFIVCLHSFRRKNKLKKSHKKSQKNKDYCNVIMPSKNTEILEFNQNQKSNKAPFIVYTDFEFSIEKLMLVRIIIHLQQKQANMFHQVFPCLQYHHLKAQKVSMTYIEVKIV